MHKITSKPITLDCFEIDDYCSDISVKKVNQSEVVNPKFVAHWHMDMFIENLIEKLEDLRQSYIETKDKSYWKELIRWLPESWLQTRTVTMNYENLLSMYRQRENHKLTEWNSFREWVETLPYSKEFITLKED